MSVPSCGASVASWDALPSEAIDLVVSYLTSDVPSLCAVACVARAWRAAAARPQLWVRPSRPPRAAAARLTDAHLITLVARAGGRLELLDLRGAAQVTDAGLYAALQQPHALTEFSADYRCHFTTVGVVAALQQSRGCLRKLGLRGVCCLPWVAEVDSEAWGQAFDALDTLMAPGSQVYDYRVCEEQCTRLCRMEDCCEHCGTTRCRRCQGHPHWRACENCGDVYCPDCAEAHDIW